MNKEFKLELATLSSQNNKKAMINLLDEYLAGCDMSKVLTTGTNEYYATKFFYFLRDGGKIPFSVFTEGNSKLPFLSFSSCPGVTCPGAGDCLNYCYSYKAWRYPAAYFRQVQNTLLMHNFKVIEKELKRVLNQRKFKTLNKIDFRLYVDGDFGSEKDLKNWMNLLSNIPKIKAYGYSKSLNLFLKVHDEGFKIPENYALNLSNGGKFDSLRQFMTDLYFVRGNFTAIKSTKKEIRKQFKNKVFICPGKCGTCTNIGHACGNLDTFKGMEIVIPIH